MWKIRLRLMALAVAIEGFVLIGYSVQRLLDGHHPEVVGIGIACVGIGVAGLLFLGPWAEMNNVVVAVCTGVVLLLTLSTVPFFMTVLLGICVVHNLLAAFFHSKLFDG